jgi:Pyruvate phosphate dikinase, AMP/ATP-binding domain
MVYGDGLLAPLTPKQVEQTKKLFADFKANPKGPYIQIHWYCKDGTVLPPTIGNPCKPHGGGNQFAELSPAARSLANLNLDVGTILAAIDYARFLDSKRDHWLPRELVLEQYLTQIDQGWIYRRSKSYRGSRQAEDEEKAGRQFLTQILGDPDWTGRNYFLLNQLTAVIPHGTRDSAVLKSRTLAAAVADHDPKFQLIRAKIHNQPGPEDLATVEKYIAERTSEDPRLKELADLLRNIYSTTPAQRLAVFQKKLGASPVAAALNAYAVALGTADEAPAGSALAVAILRAETAAGDAKTKLDMLDLNAVVLEQAFRAGQKPSATLSRRQQLASLADYIGYAAGSGLLSVRQMEALRAEIAALNGQREIAAGKYLQSIRYLERSAGWCRATAARDFGPVMRQYQPVEPQAGGLVDHLLRGSVALPLTARLELLVADASRAAGIRHDIFGDRSNHGVVALNPGVAIGKLGIIDSPEDNQAIDPARIYVIPQTLSDLEPMAGILTLESGNVLSHSQLLAANLGIPNAVVPSSLLQMLRSHRGQELFFAVTRGGVVVLREKSGLTPDEIKQWADKGTARKARISIDVGKLRLAEAGLIPLTELTARDSGAKAGPKAANLGQLAHFFAPQVAPGLVIPFGVYYAHIHRSIDGGPPLDEQIAKVYRRAEQMRDSGAPTAEVNRYIYPELARLRKLIQTMPLLPEFEKRLQADMAKIFGADGTYGVFVRSDTNAEDLPEFTGAGLNLTVPNQVGYRNIAQALKDVWASPFEERAWDWRSRILQSSEKVYPSVLLLRSVPSAKSGVIATVNLETGEDDITVNVSEGVSAVVDGGVAESLLLKRDGTVKLLEQARGTYRKMLKPAGGFENVPVKGGEYLLTSDEIRQLREMVADVKRKYPPAKSLRGEPLPWDIEFGFENGQLRLFQIRPLARYQEERTLAALSGLDAAAAPSRPVRLDERP